MGKSIVSSLSPDLLELRNYSRTPTVKGYTFRCTTHFGSFLVPSQVRLSAGERGTGDDVDGTEKCPVVVVGVLEVVLVGRQDVP